MTIDYDQLRDFVKEAMFTGGGINEPSAPKGVPHRMPAADTDTPVQDKGDDDANKMYEVALVAREATEELVEALDDPYFDDAYEHAFKASACLRRALNALEEAGAYPTPEQRVVAPPKWQQPYTAYAGSGNVGVDLADVGGTGAAGLQESTEGQIPPGTTPPAEQAMKALNNIHDEGDVRAITAWLINHPEFTQITK